MAYCSTEPSRARRLVEHTQERSRAGETRLAGASASSASIRGDAPPGHKACHEGSSTASTPIKRAHGPHGPHAGAPSTGGLPRLQRTGCLQMDYDDRSDDELTGVAATREIYATFGYPPSQPLPRSRRHVCAVVGGATVLSAILVLVAGHSYDPTTAFATLPHSLRAANCA